VDEVAILAAPDAHLRPGPEPAYAPLPPCLIDPCLPCEAPEPVAPPPPPSPVEHPPSFTDEDVFRVQAALVEQCERLRDRFAVLEPPLPPRDQMLQEAVAGVRAWRKRFDTKFAALYFPWPLLRDPLRRGSLRAVPPCGHVAGIYARFDLAEGVHRPPANGELRWVQAAAVPVEDALHGVLNPEGINAIRAFPGRGIRVYGARTLSSDPLWRYVNVRRLMSMIEESIEEAMQWSVFEPNNLQLRELLRLGIGELLEAVWRQGALAGDQPEEAFFVKCDAVNNPPSLADLGRLVVDVGVAPAAPGEFIVVRVGRTRDELRVTEIGPAEQPLSLAGRV
ncbi:MAG: phage tail sheath family protein, partial [Dehalococcoidia bacterium]